MSSFVTFLLVIAFVLILVFISVIIKYVRVYQLGANLSLKRCLFMSFRKTLKEDLIKAIAVSQKSNTNIEVDVLEAHFLAGGSPLKCVEAMEYAKKKGKVLDIKQVTAANLIDLNLIKAIDKSNEILKLNFTESGFKKSNIEELSFEFIGEYKMSFASACFIAMNKKKLQSDIKEKLIKFFNCCESIEYVEVNKMISEVILDKKYWESKGLILECQEVKILSSSKK